MVKEGGGRDKAEKEVGKTGKVEERREGWMNETAHNGKMRGCDVTKKRGDKNRTAFT